MLLRTPGEDVSGEDAADDVAEVGDVVDVGQGGGDEDVSTTLHRQLRRARFAPAATTRALLPLSQRRRHLFLFSFFFGVFYLL